MKLVSLITVALVLPTLVGCVGDQTHSVDSATTQVVDTVTTDVSPGAADTEADRPAPDPTSDADAGSDQVADATGSELPETTPPLCDVAPPTTTPCSTPCDCPGSAPVCLDGLCRVGAESCDSDWDCGCGRLCLDGSCQLPEFSQEIWGMGSCECPPNFPWLGADFKCSATRPATIEPWMCDCLLRWNDEFKQCTSAPPVPCTKSNQCPWRQRCSDGLCTTGSPACCDEKNQCPGGTVCDGTRHRCVKEVL